MQDSFTLFNSLKLVGGLQLAELVPQEQGVVPQVQAMEWEPVCWEQPNILPTQRLVLRVLKVRPRRLELGHLEPGQTQQRVLAHLGPECEAHRRNCYPV